MDVMSEKAPKAAGVEPPPNSEADRKPRPCPICGKLSVFEMRPFCSKRCADVDLHRWLGGNYAIPVVEDGDEEQSDSDDED